MKIICCGDRNWSNEQRIKEILSTLPKNTEIIQGCARGADKLSAKVANELGMTLLSSSTNLDIINNPGFPADWKKYSLGAGPIRNKEMLNQNPDIVIAFHDNITNSKGTKNMVHIARRKDVPVILITNTNITIDMDKKLEDTILNQSRCQLCNAILNNFQIPKIIRIAIEKKHNVKITYGGYDSRQNKMLCFPSCEFYIR